MSYVFYDLETTGLRKRFDQIVQFAAVRTDLNLEVVDQFEVRVRLSPHIIPSPAALKVTGTDIRSLTDPSRPTVYEAMRAIHERMTSWGQAIFIGYNSISFDEEVLRHSLYQSLLPAYLTVGSNSRADALNLARVTASLRPDVLSPGIDVSGRRNFRLGDIAAANGIKVGRIHDAMADVELTLAICKRIRERADELWSYFVRFAKKSTVDEFIAGENVFAFCEIRGNSADMRLVTQFGQHSKYQNTHYALDLRTDPLELSKMSDAEIAEFFSRRPSPLVIIKSNASPVMYPLYDCNPDMLGDLSSDEAEQRAEALKGIALRLETIVRSSERQWPQSEHIEEQLYGFPRASAEDAALIANFHAGPWSKREEIAAQISELRFKRLARRIIFCNEPEALPAKARVLMRDGIDLRLRKSADPLVPWLTFPQALAELDELLPVCENDDERDILRLYREHLVERFEARP